MAKGSSCFTPPASVHRPMNGPSPSTRPSRPARTSEGRQIRDRNSVRRSGAPTSLAKIGRFGSFGHRVRWCRVITTQPAGKRNTPPTSRRLCERLECRISADFHNRPQTWTVAWSRFSTSRRRPAASPQRSPTPAATATIPGDAPAPLATIGNVGPCGAIERAIVLAYARHANALGRVERDEAVSNS